MRHMVNILALAAAAISLPWLLDGVAQGGTPELEIPPATSAGFCQLTFDQIAADQYQCTSEKVASNG